MDSALLDKLAAELGEAILARVGPAPSGCGCSACSVTPAATAQSSMPAVAPSCGCSLPTANAAAAGARAVPTSGCRHTPQASKALAKGAEGLNIPDLVCPGCTQRCPQTCEAKTKKIVAAGADRVSASETLTRVDASIAGLIDHTLLKPEATAADVKKLCAEARKYGFASVCVNPYWVPLAVAELKDAKVAVCTVAGFPLGATSTAAKVVEAETAVRNGATEIDMVINVGALRSGDYGAVKGDIDGVARACHAGKAILKAILECALLDDAQIAVASSLAKLAGADFVKTSTGFGPHGATAKDVALMRQVVGPDVGVKAAGGIRTLEDLKKMMEAGATRIGASASVKIVESTAA